MSGARLRAAFMITCAVTFGAAGTAFISSPYILQKSQNNNTEPSHTTKGRKGTHLAIVLEPVPVSMKPKMAKVMLTFDCFRINS